MLTSFNRDQNAAVGARLGLAEGLVLTSFVGVDDIVLGWALREGNPVVQQHLLEHMARFASTFPRYEEMVVEVYRSASRNTLPRPGLKLQRGALNSMQN
jgi:hypothetical protein